MDEITGQLPAGEERMLLDEDIPEAEPDNPMAEPVDTCTALRVVQCR
jgi:hypothetical protein